MKLKNNETLTRNIRKPGIVVILSFVHLLKIVAVWKAGALKSRPTHIANRCAKLQKDHPAKNNH